MSSYSMAVVMGNLTADPKVKYLQSGTAIVSMTVAVNHRIPGRDGAEGRDEASFIDVTVFGKRAEVCSEHLAKGSSVLVEGRLKQERWEDRNSGQKRSRMVIIANDVRFVGPKRDREREPGEEEPPMGDADRAYGGSPDDDIPF